MMGELRVSLVFVSVSALISIALTLVNLPPFRFSSYITNLSLFLATWMVIASIKVVFALCKHRPDMPFQFLKKVEFNSEFYRKTLISMPIILSLVIFMPAFSSMKSAIPFFNAYNWDVYFINADIRVHGVDPWRLLQHILGYPIVTSAVSVAYHMWILLIYAGSIYFAFYSSDRALRLRYFTGYCAIWTVNGVILAILFASVGPCFVGPLQGNGHYAEQMAYLVKANASYPVMSLDVQQQLIAWQASGSNGLGRGISAMPSMHVSLAFLFFLAMRHVSRAHGIFFFLFFLIILVGSVHLGYHYAVDGYVAIVVTGVIWWACGRIFRLPSSPEGATSST